MYRVTGYITLLMIIMAFEAKAQLFVNNGAQVHIMTDCQLVIGGETQNVGPGILTINGTAFVHIFGNFRLLGGIVTFENNSTGLITENVFVSKSGSLYRNGTGLFAITRRMYNSGFVENSGLFEIGIK